jgi:site-specific DNA-cytosine methylase
MGYSVEARILDPSEYGELTGRKRAVVLATTDPVVTWPESTPTSRTLGEILHKPDDPACEWFTRETKPWLFDHWEKQTAKGNGFAPPVLTESTTKVPTIKKRYFAQQGDNPVVGHPTNPDLFRWLTVTEVKRLHGVPDDYDLGEAKTVAGEMLGHGVVVGFFRQVVETLTLAQHEHVLTSIGDAELGSVSLS